MAAGMSRGGKEEKSVAEALETTGGVLGRNPKPCWGRGGGWGGKTPASEVEGLSRPKSIAYPKIGRTLTTFSTFASLRRVSSGTVPSTSMSA